MDAALAATPVLLVLLLMVGRGWTAARAGTLTAAFTLVLAVAYFDFGGAGDPFTVPAGILGVVAEASFIAATVVAIIGPALGIHYQAKSAATPSITVPRAPGEPRRHPSAGRPRRAV